MFKKLSFSANKFLPLVIAFILVASGYFLVAHTVSAQLQVPASLNILNPQTAAKPSISLTSNDLTLVWSANTYIPPNYPGKALPVFGSVIEVLAFPISPAGGKIANINFNWYLDGTFQDFASGANKQKFAFKTDQIASGQQVVNLKITDQNDAEILSLSTVINIVSPEAILYPTDNQSSNFSLARNEAPIMAPGGEKTFVALPYFFSVSSLNNLNYQWTFEGKTMDRTEEKNKFTIKTAASDLTGSFQRELDVLAVNPLNEIQRAVGKIIITIQK